MSVLCRVCVALKLTGVVALPQTLQATLKVLIDKPPAEYTDTDPAAVTAWTSARQLNGQLSKVIADTKG